MSNQIVIGVADAHNRASELIDAVQAGATVAITRRGTVAARLVPAHKPPSEGNGQRLAVLIEKQIATQL